MPILTDEEADALDEELTRTVPKLIDVEGPFIKNYRSSMLVALDQFTARFPVQAMQPLFSCHAGN
jgi:hypothetical protein